jgi:xanthine/uracil/vitamin C permease (AzgA family)
LGDFFRFSERGTNLRTEVIAGLTTFMTMAYIIFVNPAILGTKGTGLPISGVFFATCITAAASVAMGVFANFPVALASGLGLNAIVAFTLILGLDLRHRHSGRPGGEAPGRERSAAAPQEDPADRRSGAVGGGATGASSVTSYIESGAGVAEGGRTGLTSVVVGLHFLVALPFSRPALQNLLS